MGRSPQTTSTSVLIYMPTAGGRSSRSVCPNFSEVVHEARERSARRRNGPQPWIVRKLAVGIVIGILGYAYYVYVVTFCIPMIQEHRNALGKKRIGIAFLVTFNILFLLLVWAYAKAVFTSPGYALEHTHQAPPPVPRSPEPFQGENDNSGSGLSSRVYDDDDDVGDSHHFSTESSGGGNQNGGLHQTTDINMIEAGRHPRPSFSRQYSAQQREVEPVVPAPAVVADPQMSLADVLPPVMTGRAAREERSARNIEDGLPPPVYSRRPPTHPVLSPEFRYCPRDGIVKPMRSHHCRACGTCVLKYDHHCPWIGQCVGAHNQKFFINFLQWASLFTFFVFTSVLVMYARLGTLNPEPPINAQHLVILGLSFIFVLFPLLLLMTQIYLTVYNLTTVEHLHLQRMQEREKSMLSEMIGLGIPCSSASPVFASVGSARRGRRSRPDIVNFKRPRWPWQAILLRSEIRRRWDQEWGRLGTEGNLWWLGSKRANWEAVMGKSKWGWFLPIGHSLGDGLSYPRNPRFDPDGRWRRRSQWPDGLR